MSVDLAPWLSRLEARHLANLQFAEVVRGLRALSSTYVERRQTALPGGGALDGAGKRAAFALYYGPLHFLSTMHVLDALGAGPAASGMALPVIDLGCGTGAAGAAAALATRAPSVLGLDTHPWALDEARDTYATFGLAGSVTRTSAARLRPPRRPALIVACCVVNELADADRTRLQQSLIESVGVGSRALIIEPLSRHVVPWWPEWVDAFGGLDLRADVWKMRLEPLPLVRRLGEAAGLTPGRVHLRTLFAGGHGG